ncbi:MAG: vitamin B12-dependent ribonucleotide reductase [Eubacteriales bacterium]|nr:vitamin B12-dependent ribonucleotide reductase [Eubacteriales bacterium]
MIITDNARVVLERRYLKKDDKGICERPEDMLRRVARTIASADERYGGDVKKTEQAFYDMMSNLLFLPNSPTLMNAGRELGQLSACFVLPIEDSMEDIFDSLKNAAMIHKSGGGTGFSFSRIRPDGASVNSTGGVASGPISFMKVFNASTEAVKQGGTRRGANMGILRVDHPDIMDFITCKSDPGQLNNFNLSVGLTEAFMQAMLAGKDYDLIDPSTGEITDSLSAGDVYDTIIDMAWQNGEPGIVFLDRINKDNPVPSAGEIESTNPCGEQPLLPYESCNLGSINLNAFIRDGSIDYAALGKTVETAVHLLDNVIDINKYPLEIIEKTTKSMRKIGLGVMGFSDMLYQLGIPYNTEEGIKTARALMAFIQQKARQASRDLGAVRGSFPLFDQSVYKEQGALHMRNATVTTIAPTGTISIIAGVSSGIEPVFAISYVRNVMDDDKLIEVHPYFEKTAKEKGFYSQALMREIAEKGSLHGVENVPNDIQNVFVTAHDIAPEFHIRMQSAFQESTDNAVSKTVNFPSSAGKNDVRAAYDLAYRLGLKGVTIYRDGSRAGQVLSVGKTEKETDDDEKRVPRDRPEVTQGITQKIRIGCGNLYVTVNYDDNGICEVFTNVGRAGGCPAQSEATSRLVSTALRSGIDVQSVIEQLRGIRCHSTIKQKGLKVLSCPDAIGRVLERVVALRSTDCDIDDAPAGIAGGKCPDCASQLEHEGGCVVCRSCGYSKCG